MAQIPVTLTSILIPRRRSDLLTRERLLKLLDSFSERKLIQVTAPAGYGKTSLLIDYAHLAHVPICWYGVDRYDQDLIRFLAHFISAINHSFPEFGQASRTIVENAVESRVDVEAMVTTLVNDIVVHVPESFWMVLDDFDWIIDHKPINDFLRRFVERMGDNCHVVTCSRQQLDWPELPVMRARTELGMITSVDLSLTVADVKELAVQNYHLAIPDDLAAQLVDETDGWITALQILAPTKWEGFSEWRRTARSTGQEIYAYLSNEVLNQQPLEIRNFLLRSSLLGEFNVQLCEDVLGATVYPDPMNWEEWISQIVKENLFVLTIGDDENWFRYHNLLQQFLQERMQQELANEVEPILRRLAVILEERQEWERVYEIYQRLGDVTAQIALLNRTGSTLIKQGRYSLLGRWLNGIPEAIFERQPNLKSLEGAVALVGDETDLGLLLLNDAVDGLRSDQNLPQLARTLARRSAAFHFLGRYQESLDDGQELLLIVQQLDSKREFQAEANRLIGLNLKLLGKPKQAIRSLKKALQLFNELGDEYNAALVYLDYGIVHWFTGLFQEAEKAFDASLTYWRKMENFQGLATLMNCLGLVYQSRGDYERALISFNDALEHANKAGYSRMAGHILTSLGAFYLELTAYQAAQRAFQMAQEIAERIQHSSLLIETGLAEAILARIAEQPEQARQKLESITTLVERNSSHHEAGYFYVERGRIDLLERKNSEAVTSLKHALHIFEAGDYRVEKIKVLLLLAASFEHFHNHQEGFAYLKQALLEANELPNQLVLMTTGREIRSFLHLAAQSSDIAGESEQLLRRIEQFELELNRLRKVLRQITSVVPFDPPNLVINAFSPTQISVMGETIPIGEGRLSIPFELFFYLLTNIQGATKGSLALTFWPDLPQEQVNARLKHAIATLRASIGKDTVIFDGVRYRFNQGLDYQYDVERYNRLLEQAANSTERSERVEYYRQAVPVYQGQFLPNVSGSWAVTEGHRLWLHYVEAIVNLAEYHLERGEYSAALDYCKRALVRERGLEEIHRLAMRIYAAKGNLSDVARQYRECVAALEEQIGALPSQETEDLYHALIRSGKGKAHR